MESNNNKYNNNTNNNNNNISFLNSFKFQVKITLI